MAYLRYSAASLEVTRFVEGVTLGLPVRGLESMARHKPQLTPLRRSVLVEASRQDHPTAADIWLALRCGRPRVGLSSVYRVLDFLLAAGLLYELRMGSAATRYEAATTPHQHAVCRGCGRVVDIHVPVSGTLRYEAARAGFRFEQQRLEVTGLCERCR